MAANSEGVQPRDTSPKGDDTPRPDVNLLTGCSKCDEHGPDEHPPLTLSLNLDERRDFHRAKHNLARAVEPLVDWLADVLARLGWR